MLFYKSIFCYLGVFSLSNSFLKYTAYLTYVVNLNYWGANLIFIYLIILSFYFTKLKFFIMITLTYLCKQLTFSNIIFYKILVINLVVGTVVLHPFLFYISLVFFFLKNYSKSGLYLTNSRYISLYLVSVFLVCTLFLGNIWALQSTSWGYFWVGDIIEWILLFKIVHILFYLHLWKNVNLYYNWFITIFSVLSIIVLIRLNLLSTRHNFISVNITSYAIILFYFVFLEIFYKNFSYFKKYNYRNWIVFIIVVLTVGLGFFNYLVWVKYVYMCCVIFFLYKIIINSIYSLLYHIILLSFYLIWAVLFNFFYVYYIALSSISYEFIQVFENSIQAIYGAITQVVTFQILEIIVFKNLEAMVSYFYIAYNLVVSIELNNFNLLSIFIIGIFVFKNGWI